jgi:predicted DNA-binding transcriptional regulator AlpA
MAKKQLKSKPQAATNAPRVLTSQEINPSRFYRIGEVADAKYFGCGKTALDVLIKDGVIPRPTKLGKRMCGYFGRQLIAIQQTLAA